MLKKTKMALMALLCVGCCAVAGAGVASYVEADAATPIFQVENGAAVRLKAEDTDFGIRFSATVGEVVAGAKYNMLILPEELVSIYDADTSENKADIVTYMKEYAAKKNGKLSIVENCKVREDGKIYGSIVNVKWQNLNRDFVGIAYYEKDGNVVVAERAVANASRSIGDICEQALDAKKQDGTHEYTGGNRTILVQKLAKADKQAAGVAQDAVYYKETFDYAEVDAGSTERLQGISMGNVADYQVNGAVSIVDINGNKAFKYEKKVSDYNLIELQFTNEKIPAGTYKLSFDLTELNDVYHKWILVGYGGAYDAWYKTLQTDNAVIRNGNTFTYYFTYTEEGYARWALCGQGTSSGWGTKGEILIDNVSLTQVESIPAKELSKLSASNDFGGNPLIPAADRGIYARDNTTASVSNGQIVADYTKDYGALLLNVGDVVPGTYKLTLDSTSGAAIMQGFTLSYNAEGKLTFANEINFNYGGFNTLAGWGKVSGNTYEIEVHFSKAYSNFAFALANCSTTIDNISFERVDDFAKCYTIDFNNGIAAYYSSNDLQNAFVTTKSIVRTSSTKQNVTIDTIQHNDSTALHVKDIGGWGAHAYVSVGTLKAGTYTVSMDIFNLATNSLFEQGYIMHSYVGAKATKVLIKEIAKSGNTYTLTVTLTQDVVGFKIGYRGPDANPLTQADGSKLCYEIAMDNLTITKVA